MPRNSRPKTTTDPKTGEALYYCPGHMGYHPLSAFNINPQTGRRYRNCREYRRRQEQKARVRR